MQRTVAETDVLNRTEAESPEPALPTQLGRYTILGRVGRGAVGEVFEAVPADATGTPVAIKAIRGMSPDSLYRFKREFRSLANVQHPNVITLHELALEDDRMFFTMELIRGVGFIEYLCGPSQGGTRTVHAPCTDFGRVRTAMLQLAEGVQAIHRAGFLHRDLKPSNVLVEDGGRVVILDFGLVRGIDNEQGVGVTADGAVLGTPLYMSPEQASGEEIGPASDWYTVGEMLYQALTGSPPYAGMGLLALLAAKKEEAPRPPSEVCPGIPSDLDQLCMELLNRDTLARPDGDQILRRLGADGSPLSSEDSGAQLFLGRDDEMEVLDRALAGCRSGKPVVVLLEGVSGIGKSALVDRFLHEVGRVNDSAVVLSGKCSERESIPYKALDSVMDMLSAYLRAMPTAAEVQAVLPRDVSAIARLFPVLLSVPAVAVLPIRARLDVMPHEARRRGIESLRELLGRIADRRPLVIYIDDLQWSDLDSLVVLESLLRDTDAPPLMLVCSFREGAPERVESLGRFVADLHAVEPPLDLRTLRLGPMGMEEAAGLAMRMLGGSSRVHRTLAEEVARESEGSPFFVAELVRHTQRTQQGDVLETDSAVSLDDVIRHRLALLPRGARHLLSVIAVAGGRLARGIATGIAADEGSAHAALAHLRAESLIRVNGTEDTNTVEIYHDRIRETVLRDLSERQTAELHLGIGKALASSADADAVALSHHFRQAGEDTLASLHTVAAADQAANALAFDRAAELYRAALDLGAVPESERAELEEKHARALASGGHQYEAAKVFLRASQSAPLAMRSRLLQEAAELLLTSGHAKEGRVALQQTLASFAMQLPKTQARAIGSLLRNRAALALGGLKYRVRDAEDIERDTVGRLDACWTAARGLIYTDGLVGADFHARHLRLALRSGDPVRIARALGFEAHLLVSLKAEGKRARALELIDEASELAERADSDYARGMVEQSRGHVHLMLGEWHQAQTHLDQAVQTFRARTRGAAQEIGYCESHAALALQFMGRARDLAPRVHDLLRESTIRAHPYAQGFARGMLGHLVFLVDDRHQEAQEQLELYREQAPWGFQAHILNYVSQTTALMRYRGDVADAWALCDSRAQEFAKFDLLRAPSARAEYLFWVAQNALAMARHSPQNAALVERAKACGRKLVRMTAAYRQGYGHLSLAGVHHIRGEELPATEHLRAALRGFEAHRMESFAAVCRSHLAALVGGSEAESLRAEAGAYVQAQRIVAPDQLFEMMSPGSSRALQ